jgi:predicted DNA-binding transcriptional regulator AlpA
MTKQFQPKEIVWYNKFKDGRTARINDPQKHRGRPKTSHADENCVIVKGLRREDRRVEVREITEVTVIAESTVHEIILDLNFPQNVSWMGSENAHRGAQE